MIRIFRKIFFSLLYISGIGHLMKYINSKRKLVPILLFHRVSDSPDPYWSPLSTNNFKKVINFFSARYKIRPLQDLFKYSPAELSASCFIVFDDAFKDFQQNALPFLREKNIPVTMFLPVESIQTGKPIWTTWLNMCIDQTGIRTIKINSTGEVYDISSKLAKVRTAKLLTDWLKSLDFTKFKMELKEIIKQIGENPNRPDIGVMDWNEILETAAIVDYQSHTMSHPMLGNIVEKEELDYEMGDSKKSIENELNKTVQYISYPIGSYSEAVLQKSGEYYDAGFAVDGRLVDLKIINHPGYKYRIPRFNVSDPDPYELFFRINGFHKMMGR